MYSVIYQDNGFQAKLAAAMANIDYACRCLERFLEKSGLQELKFEMVLGAREILNNAVIHGSSRNPELNIEFSVSIQGSAIVMEVIDEGAGFDFTAYATAECDPMETCGRGLQILKSYFDTVSYQPPGNRVALKKELTEINTRWEIIMTEITREGDRAVIKLGHDIVSTNVEELRNEFRQVMRDGINQISLNLEAVTYIDSMGLGLLVATHNSLQKKGNKLHLSHISADITRLLKEMRLDAHFDLS